jgi:hypothetical protein
MVRRDGDSTIDLGLLARRLLAHRVPDPERPRRDPIAELGAVERSAHCDSRARARRMGRKRRWRWGRGAGAAGGYVVEEELRGGRDDDGEVVRDW